MGPSVASAQQSVDFYLGGFVPTSLGSRDVNDVLVQDSTFLDFDMGGFTGFTFGGDFLIALGDKFDAGLGLGYYQRSVVAADSFSEFDTTGAPILATLQLRIVPFDATIRWLPLGHNHGVQPYVGAGRRCLRLALQRERRLRGQRQRHHHPRQLRRQRRGGGTGDSWRCKGCRSAAAPAWAAKSAISMRPVIYRWIRVSRETRSSSGGFNYLFTMNFKF